VNDPRHEPRIAAFDSLFPDLLAEFTAANEAYLNGTPRGALSGIPKLDRELGGAFQPGVHILHAGSGAGKTALAGQMAARAGCPALYISAEMGLLELARRHIARETETYLGRLKTGELSPPAAMELARQTAAALPDLALVDATLSPAYPTWIKDRAEAIRGRSPHLLIVIDSIHSWAESFPTNEGGSEYDTLNYALKSLRDLAAALACPVLGIAERNRGSREKGGIAASAGSRKFEYGAETVLSLERKDDVQPDANGEVPVTLKLEKNRNGAAGRSVPLKFHGALQRFTEG